MNNVSTLRSELLALAKRAGDAILPYCDYTDADLGISHKENDTVVTLADHAANAVLVSGLKQLSPHPIITEEQALPSFEERQQWSTYWLIDPLDGTRGFVENRASFTVNIALIHAHEVSMGIVVAPVEELYYSAAQGEGAWQHHPDGTETRCQGKRYDEAAPTVMLGCYGKTHYWQEHLAKHLPRHSLRHINSSLKFCLLAAGEGDFYPKRHAISEWDTAAGQCILQEAGGAVLSSDGKPLQYNRKASILNSSFVAMADARAATHLVDLCFK